MPPSFHSSALFQRQQELEAQYALHQQHMQYDPYAYAYGPHVVKQKMMYPMYNPYLNLPPGFLQNMMMPPQINAMNIQLAQQQQQQMQQQQQQQIQQQMHLQQLQIQEAGAAAQAAQATTEPPVVRDEQQVIVKRTKQTRVPQIIASWLSSHYEAYPDGRVARQELYNHYLLFCKSIGYMNPGNPSSFGKITRHVFQDITTRRIGKRGDSKYHYFGIRAKSDEAKMFIDGGYLIGGKVEVTFAPMPYEVIPEQRVHRHRRSSSNANIWQGTEPYTEYPRHQYNHTVQAQAKTLKDYEEEYQNADVPKSSFKHKETRNRRHDPSELEE